MAPISSYLRLETPLFSNSRLDEELTPLPISPSSEVDVNDLFPVNVGENPSSRFVVMKFGGTSVAKQLSNIVDVIVPSQHIQNKRIPVLVCSAQSYTSKSEGTTQCLLDAIDAAMKTAPDTGVETVNDVKKGDLKPYVGPLTPPPTPPQAESPTRTTHILPVLPVEHSTHYTCPSPSSIIDGIFERHCAGARRVLLQQTCDIDIPSRESIVKRLEEMLREDCNRVERLLSAVQMLGEISGHIRDKIVSVGELMSCRTVVAALESRGLPAHLVDLTDLNVTDVTTNDQTSLDHFVAAIRNKLTAASICPGGKDRPILIATGFFGRVPGSLLEFIGRGYTDVCAALCARAVAAEELQIWKEVDGVFSADPRKIKSAQLLPEITSVQAKLLTAYGSEVIHHRAIDQAVCAGIPILVKNVVNPTGAGTRVETSTGQLKIDSIPFAIPAPPVFAVTVLNDLELVDVRFDSWELSPDRHPLAIVLDIIQRDKHRNIAMDLITTSQDEVSFVISNSGSHDEERSRTFDALKLVANVTRSVRMSYVQVVFDHRDQTACLIAIMKALSSAQIEVTKLSHRRKGDGVGFIVESSVALKAGEIAHDALLHLQK